MENRTWQGLRLDWLDSEISGPVTAAEARLTRISRRNFHPALKEFFDPLRTGNPRTEQMHYYHWAGWECMRESDEALNAFIVSLQFLVAVRSEPRGSTPASFTSAFRSGFVTDIRLIVPGFE